MHIDEYLNKLFKTDKEDYVIACDTDSMYIRLERLVDGVFKDDQYDVQRIMKFLDNVCEKKLQPFIDDAFSSLGEYMQVMKQRMVMKREAIANKGIWTGKKHYILNVYNNEGVEYREPKLKMQGIEAVRFCSLSRIRTHRSSGWKEPIHREVNTHRTAIQSLANLVLCQITDEDYSACKLNSTSCTCVSISNHLGYIFQTIWYTSHLRWTDVSKD